MRDPHARRLQLVVVLVVTLGLLLAACGGGEPEPVAATPRDLSGRGPHGVGATRLALDAERPVVVFYPIETEAVPERATSFTYTAEDTFRAVAPALPAGLIREVIVEGAFVDVPASRQGPFPLVVFSHGRGGTPFSQSAHYVHLASWGFVVAAPRHPNRDLLARLVKQDVGTSDVTTILDTRALVAAESARAGSVLHAAVATDEVSVEGHSQGGRDAVLSAYKPEIDTWISLAGAAPVPDDETGGHDVPVEGNSGFDPAGGEFDLATYLANATPPNKPGLLIAGATDDLYPVANHTAVFEWLTEPKRLAVLADTGHSVFFDTCAGTQARGGMGAIADALGLDRSSLEIRMVEDGCLPEDALVKDVTAVWNHLAVAHLRSVFGPDRRTAAASLTPAALERMFPGRLVAHEATSAAS